MKLSPPQLAAASVLCCALTVSTASMHASAEPGRTWYVSATAMAGGNGTEATPFNTLQAVQQASGDGDTIVVLAAPLGTTPLDGGIALKQGQRLLGRQGPGGVAAVANTTTANDGDAVRLAPNTEVRDLTVTDAQRGGIYGRNVGTAVIAGNTIAATNRACHDGFLVQPFPPMLGVPFGTPLPVAPNVVALNNGWAGIMIDSDAGGSALTIERNTVRDTACGDGIDVRTTGTAQVTAAITDNLTENINQGLAKLSVLAVGMQSTGTSALTATVRSNTQRNIAVPANDPLNAAADSEGIFVNAAERARMRITIDRNSYRHGGGHFSANGIEFVTSNGTPDSEVTLTNSEFLDVPGDIVENLNLSAEGARHVMTIDGLTASRSSFVAALLNPYVPGNLGSCLFSASFGRDNTTALTLRNAHLSQCSADGIGIYAYSPSGPAPATATMSFDIADTTITDAAVADLQVHTVGDLAKLTGKVERSRFSGDIVLSQRNSTLGAGSVVDFGGGRLGSAGDNCFSPATEAALAAPNLPLDHPGSWPICG
ncbi:right-handed parallel beta-helix repeat-containing protein [Nocardia sp. XZ_19_369]|uniref:right-handed parallel beta-helix repeat-containing protein n=1 Tax=Nocardia sp. XZ_19_369 TaxID=2769487 RepID=UPI00188E5C67|nr:right-handed parallel beta-helix repeat-containing protein [Nocardia sp. XZ_19_369]